MIDNSEVYIERTSAFGYDTAKDQQVQATYLDTAEDLTTNDIPQGVVLDCESQVVEYGKPIAPPQVVDSDILSIEEIEQVRKVAKFSACLTIVQLILNFFFYYFWIGGILMFSSCYFAHATLFDKQIVVCEETEQKLMLLRSMLNAAGSILIIESLAAVMVVLLYNFLYILAVFILSFSAWTAVYMYKKTNAILDAIEESKIVKENPTEKQSNEPTPL